MASNALEGLNNSKMNQYVIDQKKAGLSNEEISKYITDQLKTNPNDFLSKFD